MHLRILVTGGAGFIGSNFVKRTIETRNPASITVLDSLTYAGNLKNLREVEGEISFIQDDIRNEVLLKSLVKDVDLVVHFAAESHNDRGIQSPGDFIETNVNGTFQILEAVRKFGKRLHHISTDEVYGDLPLDSKEKFTEGSIYKPSSPYSASKAASDHLVRAWVRTYGIEATISNCSNNFGPNQHLEKLIPSTIARALSGKSPQIYGDGLNIRDWIHVDDHVDGIWAILDRGVVGETYLLGANQELSNLEVVTRILEALEIQGLEIEFIKDRPGHDLRYAIDASKANHHLGWRASRRLDKQSIVEISQGLRLP
jgi:dTDP-glucose 4,6-dehydratase